jgi:hypothetical protein
MLDCADWPALMVADIGLAAIVKSGTRTVTAKVVEWVSAEFTLSTPFTVTEYVPAGVFDAVATVRVDVVLRVAVVGLTEQIAFVGHPEDTLRFTVPLYPLIAVTLILDAAAVPAFTVAETGFAPIEKSAAPVLPPQLLNLKEPMRVYHPAGEVVGRYSLMYQNVQSSDGSMRMEL